MENPSFDDDRAKLELHPADEPSSDWASRPPPAYTSPSAPPPSYYMTQSMTPAQPQQQVVEVAANRRCDYLRDMDVPMIIAQTEPAVDLSGAIMLSCFVTWFCSCLFGLIALKQAMDGRMSAAAGDHTRAKELRRSSYSISFAGIVMGIGIGIAIGIYYYVYANRVAASTTPYAAARTTAPYYRKTICYNSYYGTYYYC